MKKTLLVSSAALLLLSACATQDDGDVLFSDTEKEIIKTLVYADPASDATNAYSENSAAATLGQKFFWDPQFSGGIVVTGNRNGTTYAVNSTKLINCAACHDPNAGWADSATRPNDVSLGANFTSRNAPTILNSAHNTYNLWDGSSDTLWGVARPAIEGNPHNFGRMGVAYVICQNSVYQPAYISVFGSGGVSAETTALCPTVSSAANPIGTTGTACGATSCLPTSANSYGKAYVNGVAVTGVGTYGNLSTANKAFVDKIFANFGKAIAAYERLIISKNSAFDRWANGSESAMTVAQKRGLKIFIGKGNCVRCHSGPNFADGKYHNLGVPQVGGYSGNNDTGRYSGISKLQDSTDNGGFNTSTSFNDSSSINRVTGLSAVESDKGKFKTPTLRNVSDTAPYFHNGTFTSLWDVVNFYNFAGNGGNFPGTKDTILTTRHMNNEEMEDLVSFLKALDGEALSTSLTVSPGGFGSTLTW